MACHSCPGAGANQLSGAPCHHDRWARETARNLEPGTIVCTFEPSPAQAPFQAGLNAFSFLVTVTIPVSVGDMSLQCSEGIAHYKDPSHVDRDSVFNVQKTWTGHDREARVWGI